jgi:molybdopterin-guanine dinucleotide biosynthesis protein A
MREETLAVAPQARETLAVAPQARETLAVAPQARETLAVVLAGGLARRMGGGDKPLRSIAGRPLLDHLLDRLRPQVARVILNANGDPARFAAYGLPVVPDGIADHPGPLAGILAALDHAAAQHPELPFVLSVTGDAPFIPADLCAGLHAAREAAGVPLACARSAGQTHPPIGLWPVALRGELRAALLAGERKIDRWTARFGCVHADWPAEPFDPFFNANTPDDLAAAEALLAAAPPLQAPSAEFR